MGQLAVDEDRFAGMLAEVRRHLNELQWRLLLGAHARSLGRGGIKRVAELTGVHPDTVGRGARELEQGIEPDGRVRQAGAGRPGAEALDPSVAPALKALVDPDTRGDPESPLRWTARSARNLSDALTQAGHVISPGTVERLLKEDGCSLQGSARTAGGKQHPDRDGQFRHINALVTAFRAAGDPVISVDTRKRNWRAAARTAGRSSGPRAHRSGWMCTTSRASWAGPSLTASMT